MTLIKLEYANSLKDTKGRNLVGYRETMRVNFINAYPQVIGAVNLDAASENAYTTFNVDFQYESYRLSYDGLGTRSIASELLDAIF